MLRSAEVHARAVSVVYKPSLQIWGGGGGGLGAIHPNRLGLGLKAHGHNVGGASLSAIAKLFSHWQCLPQCHCETATRNLAAII